MEYFEGKQRKAPGTVLAELAVSLLTKAVQQLVLLVVTALSFCNQIFFGKINFAVSLSGATGPRL